MVNSMSTFTVLKILAELNFLAPVSTNQLIRVGRCGDGGYVLPESLLREVETLISMGINDEWSFEEDFLARNPSLKIHAYDHTISRKIFRRKIMRERIRKFLGKSDAQGVAHRLQVLESYEKFFTGNIKHFAERIHSSADSGIDADMRTVFERTDSTRIFVKMDIEGSEYRVIDDLFKHSAVCVGLAIEFHKTNEQRQAFVSAVKTLQGRYDIVHLHANNWGSIGADNFPETLEITFVKKGMCHSNNQRIELPLPGLDFASHPDKNDYKLEFTF